MQQPWPVATAPSDANVTAGVEAFIRLVTAIRNWRATRALKWNVEVDVRLHAKEHADILAACAPLLGKLSSVCAFELVSEDRVRAPSPIRPSPRRSHVMCIAAAPAAAIGALDSN